MTRRLTLPPWSLFAASLVLASCDELAPPAPPACAGIGADWEFLGLAADSLEIVGVVATSPHDPDRLLAATRADFSGGQAGWLFVSEDDGQTWQPTLTSGTFGLGFRAAAFDFADPTVAYALPYGVQKSEDGGRTWFPADEGIQIDFDTRAGELLQDRRDPTGQTLLVGTTSSLGSASLYRSADGGATWADLAAPPDECPWSKPLPEIPGNCYLGGNGIFSLAAAPSDPAVVYAGTVGVGHMLRSEDGGVVWTWRALIEDGFVRTLAVDAADPDVVYAAAQTISAGDPPAYRSGDGGQTWTPFVEGLPEPYVGGSILQDPATGTLYFVGGYGTEAGLWRRGPGEGAWMEVATPVAGLDTYSALHLDEDGWLYVGGAGLWRVDTRTLTSIEPGPCDP